MNDEPQPEPATPTPLSPVDLLRALRLAPSEDDALELLQSTIAVEREDAKLEGMAASERILGPAADGSGEQFVRDQLAWLRVARSFCDAVDAARPPLSRDRVVSMLARLLEGTGQKVGDARAYGALQTYTSALDDASTSLEKLAAETAEKVHDEPLDVSREIIRAAVTLARHGKPPDTGLDQGLGQYL